LHIANAYAREAGVRNFEKNLDKIHRKLAKQIIELGVENENKSKTENQNKTESKNKKTKKPGNTETGNFQTDFKIDKKLIEKSGI